MTPYAKVLAAQHYAPPLFVVGHADRRGARLRLVNRRAVEYARRSGLAFDAVYPGGLIAVRHMAPAAGTPQAAAFLRATGFTAEEMYPPAAFAGEPPARRPWRWGWAALGAALGAVAAGPWGMAAGTAIGALAGAGRAP